MPSAIASMSAVAPVEVSEWTTTAAASEVSPMIAETTWSTSGRAPSSNRNGTTSAPKASAILIQRSPKLPADTHSTRSPGDSVLAKADSNAPVPDAVNTRTSPEVR